MSPASKYPYSYQISVPNYDGDPLFRVRPSAVLRYMQEAATGHLETLGLPYGLLYDEGIIFVMAAVAVRFVGDFRPGKTVTMATGPVKGHGAHMLRETVILSESGELLIEGQSSWAMIDPKSQRLLRVSDFRHELPRLPEELWHPFCDPSKLRLTTGEAPLGERLVRLADLDHNQHMNNTVYADLMLDCYPGEYLQSGGIDELFIRYRSQARLGQTLIQQGEFDGRLHTVRASVEGKICFEGGFSLKTP